MNRIKLHSMVVIACAVVMSLLGGSSRASQSCFAPPPGPICKARAGLFCSGSITTPCSTDADCTGVGTCNTAVIDGTVDGNGASVTSIDSPGGNLILTTSTLPNPTATFRVRQININLAGAGDVTAHASGTCTVPVNFTIRNPGTPNETICTDGIDTFKVTSGPNSPGGTNACATHLYSCADGLPPGALEIQPGTNVFSVASPIHSAAPGVRDVGMEMTRAGTFDGHLRLVFARSTNGGAYSAFADRTTNVVSGSTRIIGTGEWSSIRVVVATSPVIFPALSVWGRILLAFLMLAAVVWFSWRYGTTSRRVSRHP